MKSQFFILLLLIGNISFCQEIRITKRNFADFNNNYYSALFLEQARNTINEIQYLIKIWAYIDKVPNTPDKIKLIDYQSRVIPETLTKLDTLSIAWSPYEQQLLMEIKYLTDTLFTAQKYIMDRLNKFEAYDDPFIIFEVIPMIEYGGEVSQYNFKVLSRIGLLKSAISLRLNKYLLPFANENNEPAVDTKLVALKAFIKKYGLDDIENNEKKLAYLYNYYTETEFTDAVKDSIPKDRLFYEKYNKLLKELMKE
jgi:hypothetical protein